MKDNQNPSIVNGQSAKPYSITEYHRDRVKDAVDALPADASPDARAVALAIIAAGAMVSEQIERTLGEDDTPGAVNLLAMADEIASQVERIATAIEKH